MENLPTIVRDTREKSEHGFRFVASKNCAGMIEAKLDFGDYAIEGEPDLIIVERKQSVIELCGNLGRYRERFERELQRIVDAGVKRRYIIVEEPMSAIFKQQRFSKMHPNSIFGSIMSLQVKYNVHFIFAEDHDTAHRITRSLLLNAYKYRCEGLI